MSGSPITCGGVRRRAATPVEVLASLIVATLVLSLFMAAGRRARNQSVMAAERGNLRVIAQLMAKYSTNDPKGIIGPVHPEAANYAGEGYAEYGGGPGHQFEAGWNNDFDPRTRPFNDLLYGVNQLSPTTAPGERQVFREYQCLGDDLGFQSWPGFAASAHETNRPYFGANGSSFRMNNLTFYPDLSLGITGRPRSRVPFPAQTLAFFEARAFETLWTNDSWGVLNHGELLGYHDRIGFFFAIYADGHSDFVDFGDGTYYQQQPAAGELDVRGSWGRMECLPDVMTDAFAFLASAPQNAPLLQRQRIEEGSQP